MSPTTAPAPTAPGETRGSRATLPALLLDHAGARPKAAALRQKELGIWREVSWEEYASRAAGIGLGLVELGVRAGERVAIQSSNRHEWLLADAGIQGIGAVSVGLYPTSPPAQVEFLLRHSESMVLIAENEEQLDKALEVRGSLPNLEKIIVVDTRGIRELVDPMLMSLDELEAVGRQRTREEWAERVRALEPSDTAAIIYTSGATGRPKAAMLSHANLVAAATATAEAFGAKPSDEVFSYLPMCHAVERVCSSAAALEAGYTVNFGEGAESFTIDMAEVQPSIFLGVPRIWEQLASSLLTRIEASGRVQRSVFNFWVKRGAKAAERQRHGRGRGFWDLLGRFELYRSVRKKLGLRRARVAISTAAPVAPSALEFFWSIGVPVREGYGLTEFTGLATLNPSDDVRIGGVGTALSGVEVRILDDGEVVLRGPTIFGGYFRDSGSERVVDGEGWLRTGDLGILDDDHLTITGRKKAVIITSGVGTSLRPPSSADSLRRATSRTWLSWATAPRTCRRSSRSSRPPSRPGRGPRVSTSRPSRTWWPSLRSARSSARWSTA
ncbi:MAG: AMP-binding protein [Acidimicrobiia bacterium]|nr:AMP-binding protein [Acidimicrobiia bacterium]